MVLIDTLKAFIKRILFKFFSKPAQLVGESNHKYKYRLDVLRYYYRFHKEKLEPDEKKILKGLKKTEIHYFPYPFVNKYKTDAIRVLHDNNSGLKYVIHQDKRLYFKKDWTEEKIKNYYNFLLIEQDKESPHCYFPDSCSVDKDNIVLDAGSAEGNFSLSIIEEVNKIYLFEPDQDWIEPLKATFEPWKEKVKIINRFVSDKNADNHIKLDDLIDVKVKVNLIKADVEGYELRLLKGAIRILQDSHPSLLLCTYHNPEDAENTEKFLQNSSYNYTFSDGYMIFLDNMKPPYLRKVLIRAN